VLKSKSFRVESPPCRFDAVNNKYFDYALLEDVPDMAESEHVFHDQFASNDRRNAAHYQRGGQECDRVTVRPVCGQPRYFFDH
jgi:hypothetical protein